jgi:hypothetical protein
MYKKEKNTEDKFRKRQNTETITKCVQLAIKKVE